MKLVCLEKKIVWDDGKGDQKYNITGQQKKVEFAAVEQAAGSTHAKVPTPASRHLFRRQSDGGFIGDSLCQRPGAASAHERGSFVLSV
ncbi:MAG: hypothetical protein PVH18_03400 [Chloroflexota bacterium]|jgi:hypothetical protein